MSSEQFEHIQRIRQDFYASERLKASTNSSIRALATDLYKEDIHFIFELIQNAEDNTYKKNGSYPPYISFELTKTDPIGTPKSDGALIIRNNEIGFSSDNVDAICAVGQTTKKKEQGYIGEKGIGFKSVFRVTENPHIFSKDYHFCLPEFDVETGLGYIVPQWVKTLPEGLDPSVTYIILPLTKQDFGYKEIEEMLRDIEPEIILFLFKLQEIKIKTDTGDDFTILKDDSAIPEVQILAEGKKEGLNFSNSDAFLVCSERFDKPTDIYHEKREGIRDRKVTIGFPLSERSTAVGKLFAYLPVQSGTGFPFLINADFILPSSREDIQDVPWNRSWLMDCVADLIAKRLLPLLKERNFLNVAFLEALASKLNGLAEDKNNLFYPVFSRLRETFMKEELLPANDKTFISAQSAKLADSERLIELLNPHQLSLLFKRSGVTKWLLSDITARRTQNLWRYLRNELGIDEVDPEMFARRIDELFLEQQPDSWFIDFYKFLFVGERPPKSLWAAASNTFQRPGILRNKPILRLQNNSLVNPNESNIYLSKGTNSDTTSRLIKSEISQNEDAHKFLKELGIPEWDIVAEVIEKTLPKYWNNPSSISSAEYERDFSKIVSAYDTDSVEKKNQLREKLQTTSFIFVNGLDASSPMYLKPNQLYFGTDGLWIESAGIYSSVSVSDDVFQFLKKLGIPQWDVVEEIIETVLPKYSRDSPKVTVKDHMEDFQRIYDTYRTCDHSEKIDLQIKLQTVAFILAESPLLGNPDYYKPTELYFSTDELCLYFHGNDSYKFVSSKYSDQYTEMFKELEISDRIQITCRSGPGATHDVHLPYQYRCYRRGLKGFDPDIQVAGLKHALMNPSVEKSKVIWERVVPYSHCITGKILRSSRQNFSVHARIYEENEVTSDFGRMLMENAWIPDFDGNMHKPSEITLAELHKGFIRDERLANQLGMKKDEVAELADKIGISEKDIKDFVENKEEYIEWKTEKAKREQVPLSESEESESKTDFPQIDYLTEIEKSFNKSGKTEVQPHIIDDGRVNNPERRREKIAEEHRDRLNREPSADDRRRKTYRTLLEGPDPQVREYLFQMYGGKCQICDHTFPERDGEPFFVASYIVKRQKSGMVDTAANALCLCADHFAKFEHGAIEAEDVPTQIENFQTESEGGNCKPILKIKLCGEKCEIRYNEKHLLDLQELIKVSSED